LPARRDATAARLGSCRHWRLGLRASRMGRMRRHVCQVRIDSYFSLPTDLAADMRNWPEFVGGVDYDVEFESEDERVIVRFVPADDDDRAYVRVRGEYGGRLFLTVLGYVSYAMAGNSDEIEVMRWEGSDAI
jgi:hypothetical protein